MDFQKGRGASHMAKPVLATSTTIFLFLGLGTIVYHRLEHWSWVDSLYFTTYSLTTVGYGDLTPTTTASKLFTVGFLLCGVAAVVASLGVIGSRYLEIRDRKMAARRNGFERSMHDNKTAEPDEKDSPS